MKKKKNLKNNEGQWAVILIFLLNLQNVYIYDVRTMMFYRLLLLLLLAPVTVMAQYADYSKMSSMVRKMTIENRASMRRLPAHGDREVCAFVRITHDGPDVLSRHHCRQLACFGDIYIASIPFRSLAPLSLHPSVARIEANRGCSITMDTTLVVLGGAKAHEGVSLPHAFTGEGVVVGVQDIGFDLTHPNFYDASATTYRIKRFWDFLSLDTLDSPLYVGAEYITEEAIKAYAHSRDGLAQTHGTHTLGSAAGSGFDSPYKGIAPGSDICLVSNAVGEDLEFIDSLDIYKYTYATDALGFKYLFDYADAVGKPCVVSFSEGSSMDFRGDDALYYEILDSLAGPGHILVASAGNAGTQLNHAHKHQGTETAKLRLYTGASGVVFAVKSRGEYTMRLHLTGNEGEVIDYDMTPTQILACEDSTLTDTLSLKGKPYIITATSYPSCFDSTENVVETILETDTILGLDRMVTVEIIGREADVEFFRSSGYIAPLDATVCDNSYTLHSPSSAPSVISVGANGYRTGIVNYKGEYRAYDQGTDGQRSNYSSVGPTYDGRIKPDVLAPGTNVISSYSSYYLENNPDARDIQSDVAHFEFNGRTYAWNANSGTSMSTPVVAGAIALWLQAKPTLTPTDVLGVLERTCRHVDPQLTYPNNQYGYGEIDIYHGLLDVLGISGIEGISHHQPAGVRFSLHGRSLFLTFEGEERRPVEVRVYTSTGQLVYTERGIPVDGMLTVRLDALPHGVYAVQVNGARAATTGSTLIRL